MCGARGPVRQRRCRRELRIDEDDLGHDDQQRRNGQDPAPAQGGDDQDEPRRQIDEERYRVEDGEGLEGVPGHDAHGGHHGQHGHHNPAEHRDDDRQSPSAGRTAVDVTTGTRWRGASRCQDASRCHRWCLQVGITCRAESGGRAQSGGADLVGRRPEDDQGRRGDVVVLVVVVGQIDDGPYGGQARRLLGGRFVGGRSPFGDYSHHEHSMESQYFNESDSAAPFSVGHCFCQSLFLSDTICVSQCLCQSLSLSVDAVDRPLPEKGPTLRVPSGEWKGLSCRSGSCHIDFISSDRGPDGGEPVRPPDDAPSQ